MYLFIYEATYKAQGETYEIKVHFTFFFREFQFMTSAPDDSSLSSDQDINQFLV